MIIATDKEFKQPWIQSISSGEKVAYRLLQDFAFQWEEDGRQWRRVVKAQDVDCSCDWKTDLASVPDAAAVLGFRKLGTSDAASIIHDRTYQLFGTLKLDAFPKGEYEVLGDDGIWIDAEPVKWTRLQADRLYRRMCISGGMPVWRANIEFAALRVGAISRKNGFKWYWS